MHLEIKLILDKIKYGVFLGNSPPTRPTSRRSLQCVKYGSLLDMQIGVSARRWGGGVWHVDIGEGEIGRRRLKRHNGRLTRLISQHLGRSCEDRRVYIQNLCIFHMKILSDSSFFVTMDPSLEDTK